MSEAEKVSITWSARREGNDGWVLESYSVEGQPPKEFGPMRANIVPAFIAARRMMYQRRMEERGHTQVTVDMLH